MSRRSKKQAVDIDPEIGEDIFNGGWLMDFKIRKPFYMKPKHRDFYETLHEGYNTNDFCRWSRWNC